MARVDLDGSLTVILVPLALKGDARGPEVLERAPLPSYALVGRHQEKSEPAPRVEEFTADALDVDDASDDEFEDAFDDSLEGSSELTPEAEAEVIEDMIRLFRAELLSGSVDRRSAKSTTDNLDIGLGLAALVDHRSVQLVDEPEVLFGRSKATMDDAFARGEGGSTIEDASTSPYVSLALWQTQHGLVLSLEALAPRARSVGRSDDVIAGEVAEAVERFLDSHAAALGIGGAKASLREVFPQVVWALSGSDTVDRPLAELIVPSVERIRGRAVSSGMTLVVEAGASALVEELLEHGERTFDSTEEEQERGVARDWEPFQLALETAEPGARSAVRDDVRAVFVNQESMSVWHDYGLGISDTPALGLIPLVAYVARTENSMNELFSILEDLVGQQHVAGRPQALDDPERLDQQLEWLRQVRTERLYRTMLLGRTSPERFRAWSLPSSLASYLLTVQQARLAELDVQIEEAAAIVHESIQQVQERVRRLREARSKKFDKILSIFTPIAGASLAVGLLASLTGMPLPATPEYSETWRIAWLAFAGLVLVGTALGFLLYRARGDD